VGCESGKHIFTCANGAASDIISAYVLRDVSLEEIEENVRSRKPLALTRTNITTQDAATNPKFRRYQTLHILDCSYKEAHQGGDRRLASTSLYVIFELVLIIILLGLSALTILFGLYGTATALIIAALFRISRILILIIRPPSYLEQRVHGERVHARRNP
jgi:hypothetical protein